MRNGRAVIAGAPKCGTTSIFLWLAGHRDVCTSKEKETRYFIDPGYPLETTYTFDDGGLEGYEDLFSHCPGEAFVLEATPDYLYQDSALRMIPALDPPPHVVFSLRRPSRRIFSVFASVKLHEGLFADDFGFQNFVAGLLDDSHSYGHGVLDRCIDQSRYVRWLRRWRDSVPEDRFHVFVFEDLMADPRASMSSLVRRLGLRTQGIPEVRERANETARARSPVLHSVASRVSGRVTSVAGARWSQWLRRGYRALNLAPRGEPTEADVATMRELDELFLDDNRALADEFGLEISSWAPE